MDTGPLYALADPSDQYHNRSKRERTALHSRSVRIVISVPTTCEVHKLISRRLGYKFGSEWVARLLERETIVQPTVGDLHAAKVLVEKYADQSVGLYDALLAAASKRLQAPVWTFDRHFALMGVSVQGGIPQLPST